VRRSAAEKLCFFLAYIRVLETIKLLKQVFGKAAGSCNLVPSSVIPPVREDFTPSPCDNNDFILSLPISNSMTLLQIL